MNATPRRGREVPGLADDDDDEVWGWEEVGARRGVGVGMGLDGIGIVLVSMVVR